MQLINRILPLALAVSTTLLASNTNAFKFEANLNNTSAETDTEITYWDDTETDIDLVMIDSTFYFQDVQVEQGPWEEAGFLSKSSSLNLQVGQSDNEQNNNRSSDNFINSESDVIAFSARGVFDSLILEASYSDIETEIDNYIDTPLGRRKFKATYERDDASISIGSYIGDHQQWLVNIHRGESDISSEKYNGVGASYKNVIPFSTGKHLNVYTSLNFSEVDVTSDADREQTEFLAEAAFYPMNNLSISAGFEGIYATEEGDEGEYTSITYSAGISYFPIEQLRLSLNLFTTDEEYKDFGPSNLDINTDGVTASIGIRF